MIQFLEDRTSSCFINNIVYSCLLILVSCLSNCITLLRTYIYLICPRVRVISVLTNTVLIIMRISSGCMAFLVLYYDSNSFNLQIVFSSSLNCIVRTLATFVTNWRRSFIRWWCGKLSVTSNLHLCSFCALFRLNSIFIFAFFMPSVATV